MNASEFSEFLDFTRYFYDDDFASVIREVMGMVRTIALTNVLPLLTAIALIRAVYQHMNKNSGKPGVEFGEAVRIFGLIILVAISPELMAGVGKIIDGVTTSFSYTRTQELDTFYKWNTVKEVKDKEGLSDNQATELFKRLSGNTVQDKLTIKRYLTELKQDTDESGNLFNSITDTSIKIRKMVESMHSMQSNMLMTLVSSSTLFLLGLVKLLMGALIFIFGAILQVLAPLAFSFEMVFPGKAIKYLAVFLSVKFAFLTFLIVEAIIMGFFALAQAGMASDGSFTFTYSLIVMVTYIVAIVCYLLVFWFTSKYVGTGEAGRFLSQTVAAAAMVANAAIKSTQKFVGATAAAKGGQSGGSGSS